MKFIPIEWRIPRDNCSVNIDFYVMNEKGNQELKTEMCRECINGCDLEVLNAVPSAGIRVQVIDNAGNVLTQTSWEKNVKSIVITKDELLHKKIELVYE